jgi:hypothetical protein
MIRQPKDGCFHAEIATAAIELQNGLFSEATISIYYNNIKNI